MKRYVLKFGGSSVETIEKMKIVANKIISRSNDDTELVVVVSAMGKTTNRLFEEARSITDFPNKRELDLLLSTGEIVSISLLSIILNNMGHPAISLTGPKALIYTKGEHQSSKIEKIDTSIIEKYLKERKIVIVAGYQGVNELGDITTLGREGSDTSAVWLAHSLNCPCEIYSDVEGVYEIDPKVIPGSKKHDELTYNELLMLSYNGAKVIASSAIEFASKNKIPLYLGSTFIDSKGTKIVEDVKEKNEFIGIVVQRNLKVLSIRDGINTEIINYFYDHGVNMDLINNNLLTIANEDRFLLDEIIKEAERKFAMVEEYKEYSLVKVSVIGTILKNDELKAVLLTAFKEDLINLVFTKHNQNRLSIFINIDDTYQSIKKLYSIVKELDKND